MKRSLAMLSLLTLTACGWAEWPPPGMTSPPPPPAGTTATDARATALPPPAPRGEADMPPPPRAPSVQTAALPPPPPATGRSAPGAAIAQPRDTPVPPAPGAHATATTPIRTITVRSGETIYSLSRRHDVPTATIIQLNRLDPPYELSVGQRLALPAAGAQEHVVQQGDTLYSLARRYDVDLAVLASANGLVAPYPIREGQVLTVPVGSSSSVTSVASAGTIATTATTTTAATTPATTEGAGQTSPLAEDPPKAPADKPVVATRTDAGAPPPITGNGFAWPVQGTVISSFGSKDKGNRNDGINIAAPRGTPVRAAENGVVAYAGNELRGFGNLVLIRHADGWITAYAHNGELLVRRGDTVRRGQEIARVGSSGGVDQPQLHFQIRSGKTPTDPLAQLPASRG